MRRARVREGKGAAAVGLIAGLIFLFIGITIVMPNAGIFGVFWVLMVLLIIGASAYNVLSDRGLSMYEVDVDPAAVEAAAPDPAADGRAGDFDAKLRKLAQLKADGLIDEQEYARKRAEIMKQPW